MREWVEAEEPRPAKVIRAVGAKCDRCGKSASVMGGRLGDGTAQWGRFERLVQGDEPEQSEGDRRVADLCLDCAMAVDEFIGAGTGRGCVSNTQELRERVPR